MEFYTYQYFRNDGTPYYIGKGKENRAFTDNSKYVPVPDKSRILIQYWGSEQEALEMEKWWIQFWGRKDNKTGILRNLTDGGEGLVGYVPSDETRRRYSENAKKLWREGKGVLPPAARGFASAWNKDKKCPEISNRMMGNRNGHGCKGRPKSLEIREKIRMTMLAKGIKPSIEACSKGGRTRAGSA